MTNPFLGHTMLSVAVLALVSILASSTVSAGDGTITNSSLKSAQMIVHGALSKKKGQTSASGGLYGIGQLPQRSYAKPVE